MVERKKQSKGGLTIKGIGYVSPFAQSSAQQNSRLISRRPPFVMPSAPIKNAQVSSNRIPMTTSSRFGSASNLVTTQKEACHCQHPADVEFLKDVYLENMRMRMDMLELENKYLKGDTIEEGMPGPSTNTAARNITKKRVEFADRRIFKEPTESITQKSALPNEQELFDKLEEAYQKEFRLQEKIKALSIENKKLMASKEDAEQRLSRLDSGEKSLSRERHTLMEDNVELQRRLDDLTPLLAAKDAEIERLEMEKTNLISKIRRLSTGTATKQDRDVDDTNGNKRHQSMARNDEIERMESRIKQMRQKESEFNDEIAALKRKLKEEQMLIKREQSMRDNYAQENDRLIKENSELASQLNKQERDTSKAQIAEMRNEILNLERRLKNEADKRLSLEEQIRTQEMDENQIQDSRRKIQEELQALQALSNSLSAENQGLRQEKISISERMERLFSKLDENEKEIRHLTQLLEDFREQFSQMVQRFRAELQRQTDASIDLDKIIDHAQKLLSIKHIIKEKVSYIQENYDEVSRTSSVTHDLNEKDTRPMLSPITSPNKSKSPPSSHINRSLRTVSQHERSLSRGYSVEPTSSLAQKYRRKMS